MANNYSEKTPLEKAQYANESKEQLIAELKSRGFNITDEDSFRNIVNVVKDNTTIVDTKEDNNAAKTDSIEKDKVAFVNGSKVTGNYRKPVINEELFITSRELNYDQDFDPEKSNYAEMVDLRIDNNDPEVTHVWLSDIKLNGQENKGEFYANTEGKVKTIEDEHDAQLFMNLDIPTSRIEFALDNDSFKEDIGLTSDKIKLDETVWGVQRANR